MRNKIIDLTSEVYARQPVVLQHTRTREGEYNGNSHDLLEQKIEIVQIEDARKHVKIDRSHRIGRKREGKSCFPELKKARAAGKQSRIVKDKLIIEGKFLIILIHVNTNTHLLLCHVYCGVF